MRRQHSNPGHMRRHYAAAAGALALFAVTACSDILDVQPTTQVPADQAIVDARSANAAASGMYDDLQSTSYYGGDFMIFMDLSGPDVIHTGTFTNYADADDNNLTSDTGDVQGFWGAAYSAIGRANTLLEKLPGVASLSTAERNRLTGEAHFIRALAYHDLVRVFGEQSPTGMGVPIRLVPPKSIEETFVVRRATVAQVYAQINADLDAAEPLLAGLTKKQRATQTAVRALRARVKLYQRDWAGALAAARSVVTTPGLTLATRFQDLFTPDAADTPENIFQLTFSAADASNLGYYYIMKPLGGRREIAPSAGFSNSFEAGDLRRDVTTKPRNSTSFYGAKFPSTAGNDDVHLIRLAEVILIKAEAHAELGQLDSATVEVNKIRTRAGLAPVATFPDVATARAEIMKQRRYELALEGHRWPDLVRTGAAAAAFGTQALYPIPQREIDVTAPGELKQNPGY